MNNEILAWELICRIGGSLGFLLLYWELRRLLTLIDHPRLRRATSRISTFFLIFGLLKIITSGLDWWIGAALTGIVINNGLPFWLYNFVRTRRRRLALVVDDSSSRTRIKTYIDGIVDEMKLAQKDIHTTLKRA